MKDNLRRSLARLQSSFASFTAGQKVIAVLGTGALLLAAVLVFRWVAQPQYAPLFTNLSGADASAVVDKLDSTGVAYELTNGGATVMVPKDDVYKTRISLSGEGLPSGNDGGYSLLDNQDLSTSQFKEQTDFKRAMEGELATTIEAMDGVQTAVVHLALPEKQVFADKQAPPTASVLVSTKPGSDLDPEQVQSVVHLVAASIDGMDPAKVTVADSSGRLLSSDDSTGGAFATSRDQYAQKYQTQLDNRLQTMLDRVVGPGNSTVEVTADLNFDKSVVESKKYSRPGQGLALSQEKNSEVYKGPASGANAAGVVGPDGQMDSTAQAGGSGSASSYDKTSTTEDNALDTTTEHLEAAPGSLKTLHVAVVLDRTAAANNNPQEIERMVRSAAGIQPKRGDSMWLSVLPFDRSNEAAAAKALKAEQAAAASSSRMETYRNIALGALLLFALVLAWLRGRKRNRQRAEATNYVIEQLRNEPPRTEALESPASALLSLEGAANGPEDDVRRELTALVERQPEDVAALLRGWLVDR